jgi:hypothetical protein
MQGQQGTEPDAGPSELPPSSALSAVVMIPWSTVPRSLHHEPSSCAVPSPNRARSVQLMRRRRRRMVMRRIIIPPTPSRRERESQCATLVPILAGGALRFERAGLPDRLHPFSADTILLSRLVPERDLVPRHGSRPSLAGRTEPDPYRERTVSIPHRPAGAMGELGVPSL